MNTLRCLISNLPQKLLSDIVLATASPHMNIEVVGNVSAGEDLPALVKRKSVDVLLVGGDKDILPQKINDILDGDRDPLIICMIDDGRRAAIFLNDIGTRELEEIISAFGPARMSRQMET